MKNWRRLLRDEPPLVVCPSLAVEIGIFEAMLLQQINYWLNPKWNKNYRDGKYWVHKTYDEWMEEFPFWSKDTLRRVINSLKSQNLIECVCLSEDKRDRTFWYTIRDDDADACGENPNMQPGENPTMHVVKTQPCNKEQRLHTEITTEITKQKQTCAREQPVDNFFGFEVDDEWEAEIAKRSTPLPKSTAEEAFNQFWKLYPVKSSKQGAKAAFLKLKCYLRLPEILKGIESQILAKSEHDRLGLFHPDFPMGQKYLNLRRWEDPALTTEQISNKHRIASRSKMSGRERSNEVGEEMIKRELGQMISARKQLCIEEL